MVFQDPYESLSPRSTVLQTVMEPLVNHRIGETFEERVEIVTKALEDAGLAPAKEYLARFPHELSGGQRQRVSIARALVIDPRVIVADEPVSMLDVSIRAGVLNLMLDLRDKYRIPYLFITHDIAVARYISDRLAVMYLGKIVEIGETDRVVFESKHPYTQALISAVPVPDPTQKHGRAKIVGEIPSAINLPRGCRFRPRCPKAFEMCGWEATDLAEWLTERSGIREESHPMAQHIDKLNPQGFVLSISIKEGGDTGQVKSYLEHQIAINRQTDPMFKAIASVDISMGDRVIAIKCGSAKASPEFVARELAELLVESVDFKSRSHPMHGIITEVRQDGARVVVEVAAKTDSESDQIESTVGFLKDFVKFHSRTKEGHPEFRGVKDIRGDRSSNEVILDCSPSKMNPKRVAREVLEIIEHDFMQGPQSTDYEALFPPEVKGSTVMVQVRGTIEGWDRLVELLKKRFKDLEQNRPTLKGVRSISIRQMKGPRDVVSIRFMTVEEPPLIDLGSGHMVACYIYTHKSEDAPPVMTEPER
jgi:oligopeptide/dipeptide ABC transporter ATP-binding protein